MNVAQHKIINFVKIFFFAYQFLLVFVHLMCGPRQLFFFQCGPETPKGWAALGQSKAVEAILQQASIPRVVEQKDRNLNLRFVPSLASLPLFPVRRITPFLLQLLLVSFSITNKTPKNMKALDSQISINMRQELFKQFQLNSFLQGSLLCLVKNNTLL